MKARLLILCALLSSCVLSSCTSIQTNRNNGTTSLNSLGGNIQGYAATPEGAAVAGVDNSTSFREVTNTIKTGLWLAGAAEIAKSISDAYKTSQATKAAADVSKNAANQVTKQAAIEADKAIKTFVPPEAPLPVPP